MKPLPAFRRLKHQAIADLCARSRAGDTEARNALILANMRLVARLATKYARMHGRLDLLDDLIQEAVMGSDRAKGGLLEAIERFDSRKHRAFSTFAAYWIRNSMMILLRSQNLTAGPSAIDRRVTIRGARDALEKKLGRPPEPHEVHAVLMARSPKQTLSVATVEMAMQWSLAEVPYDGLTAAVDSETNARGCSCFCYDARATIDTSAPTEDDLIDRIDGAAEAEALHAALAQIPQADRELLCKRFGIGRRRGEEAPRPRGRRVQALEREWEALRKLREVLTGELTQ